MQFSDDPASQSGNRLGHIAARLIVLFVMMLTATSALSSDVDVLVVDRDGQPVADVAVYTTRVDGQSENQAPIASAVMDQIDRQFVPHLLVVQKGTSVEFPNSDTVAHHVYSFSSQNKFQLPMYKGTAHPPVTFEHIGVVMLGCNIHDQMLGYILVVDSATFAKTDKNGAVSLSLHRPEDYEIRIWSPRIRDGVEFLTKTVISPDKLEPAVNFQLAKKLNPPHGGHVAAWQDY